MEARFVLPSWGRNSSKWFHSGEEAKTLRYRGRSITVAILEYPTQAGYSGDRAKKHEGVNGLEQIRLGDDCAAIPDGDSFLLLL
jgi:hypothetical protein